jgi:DNA-binding response OmpR family regulator
MGQLRADTRNAFSSETSRGAGPGILIVDDDLEARRVIRDTLKQEGFTRIYEAGDGQQALDIIRDPEADIRAMLLDIMMPNLSGAHVLEQLAVSRPASLCILLISGHHDSLDTLKTKYQDSLAPHRLDTLPKPFEIMKMVSRLKALLMLDGGPSALTGLQPKNVPAAGTQSVVAPDMRPTGPPEFNRPVTLPAHPTGQQTEVSELLIKLENVESQLAGLNASVVAIRQALQRLTGP